MLLYNKTAVQGRTINLCKLLKQSLSQECENI